MKNGGRNKSLAFIMFSVYFFKIMLNVIDINVIHSSCEGLLINNDFVSFICIYLYSLVFKSMGSVRQFY